jgi:hypothetical protein
MGRAESPNLKNDYERACGWYGHFNQSEMALFSECTDRYAQKLLDTADIVREAMFQQLTIASVWPTFHNFPEARFSTSGLPTNRPMALI